MYECFSLLQEIAWCGIKLLSDADGKDDVRMLLHALLISHTIFTLTIQLENYAIYAQLNELFPQNMKK